MGSTRVPGGLGGFRLEVVPVENMRNHECHRLAFAEFQRRVAVRAAVGVAR